MQIATKIGDNPSSFKHHLKNLTPGDRVQLRGPFGWFKIQDQSSPIIFIAGGVGIAPIRALLKELEEQKSREINQYTNKLECVGYTMFSAL